ncbi:MAG: HU family DNA-binding protein [Paludibacter sp.]|nr:HU family DNA-binding protein [Paludibacter sp.]
MIKEKISSQEIIDLVASKASVSKRAAEEFLKVMIASIEEALMAGEVVKIKNFGTFKLQWNEPRKSVNIQSGEEIKINGYYKVSFIPDSALKEQVNEPFAHLEPVELDSDPKKNELIDETELIPDPLRIFNEQAFEIKNLISEIQALSPSAKKIVSANKIEPETISNDEIINDVQLIEPELIDVKKDDDLKEIKVEVPVLKEATPVQFNSISDNAVENNEISKEVSYPQSLSELPSTPYLENIQSSHKGKMWLRIVAIVVIILGLGAGTCVFYPPASELSKQTIANCQYSISKATENISISEMINTVSKWFSPAPKPVLKPVTIVIPKDTTDAINKDTTEAVIKNSTETNNIKVIDKKIPVDSLQILFDNPRVYKEFIASERITSGNRLTIISKRYYGSKDFWVYIFEANKDHISNPDNVSVGTLIRIPKMDKRLIDPTNPRCIEKAKELHDIYVN